MNALRAVTVNAARICLVDDRLGSIRVGKDADFAIYDGSLLDISSTLRATVINREFVWQKDGDTYGQSSN